MHTVSHTHTQPLVSHQYIMMMMYGANPPEQATLTIWASVIITNLLLSDSVHKNKGRGEAHFLLHSSQRQFNKNKVPQFGTLHTMNLCL